MTRPAVLRLARIELTLLRREPVSVVFSFAFPLIVLFVMAEVFGNQPDTDDEGSVYWRGVGPIDYYVPAYVALVVAATGLITLPVQLAAYRERGVLRRLRASGASGVSLVGAQVLVALAIGLSTGIVMVVAARLVYGNRLPDDVPATVGAFLLVTVAFTAIGLLLGSLLPTARAAQGVGLLLFFVMMFVCGAGPPPEALSETLRRVGDVLPLTYAVRVLQEPWLGLPAGATAPAATAGFLVAAAAGLWLVARRRAG